MNCGRQRLRSIKHVDLPISKLGKKSKTVKCIVRTIISFYLPVANGIETRRLKSKADTIFLAAFSATQKKTGLPQHS